jgi:hypothetical protein
MIVVTGATGANVLRGRMSRRCLNWLWAAAHRRALRGPGLRGTTHMSSADWQTLGDRSLSILPRPFPPLSPT